MIARVVLVALAVFATPAAALAQPASAIGTPLPAPDMAVGTIIVRVVDGTAIAPTANIHVTLIGAGAPRDAVTDAMGHVTFDHVPVGASVQVAAASPDPLAASTTFVVPAAGGTRLLLSTKPWGVPVPVRESSGDAIADDTAAPGTIAVRLTYDDLSDAHPPSGIEVVLVGYAADDHVTVQTARSDRSGTAHFSGIDQTSSVAYYALAALPRKGALDRLISRPVLLHDKSAMRILLSGERRDARAPSLDDVVTRSAATPVPTPKGKVRVSIAGVVDPKTPIELVDAATGNVLVKGAAADKEALLDVRAKAGAALYAQSMAHGQRYRSLPFVISTDRGAQVAIAQFPRVLPTVSFHAAADDDAVQVVARYTLANNAWIPYAKGMVVPVPRGARNVEVAPGDRDGITVGARGFEVQQPLPPGGIVFEAMFDVPAVKREVAWSLDLPDGTFKSSFVLEEEPGASVEAVPAGTDLSEITIAPGQSMAMMVKLPAPGRDTAVVHACRKLAPDHSALVGKPMSAWTLPQLDGKPLKSASLKGMPVLVNMMATWDMLSHDERPKLAVLAKQVKGIRIVLLASDRDPDLVASAVGATPFRTVLDAPSDPSDNIGAVTSAWGVTALPETLLVDRKGVVRYHFQNARVWDSPEAIRCVRALATER